MRISKETVAWRSIVRPLHDRILGVRRDPENGSGVIITPDGHWRLNDRVDVWHVGRDVKEDIKPGDMLIVTPKGDHLELWACIDPQFIMTFENKILAIVHAEPAIHRETGKEVRAMRIDHRWDYKDDDYEIDLVPGDFLITAPDGTRTPIRQKAFEEQYDFVNQDEV